MGQEGTQDATEHRAFERALRIAADPAVPLGPNPRVGCVLLDPAGRELASGHHRGAGTPHAEAAALAAARAAGQDLRGATAVVTLEPCAHHGRTPPCAEALLDAGITRVVIARPDPNPVAAGGAQRLREAGIEVDDAPPADIAAQAAELNRGWEHGLLTGRPLVTLKLALTLDGRIAAADGSSRWITGPAAREQVQEIRTRCDVVLVGTGTARADAPTLTARRPDGSLHARQPARAVMGTSQAPSPRPVHGAGPTLRLDTRDPQVALAELHDLGYRHVLVEGGARIAAAFLRAACVDEVIAHLAPTLLGAGPAAVGDLGITGVGDALSLHLEEVTPLTSPDGPTDLQLTLRPATTTSA